MTTDPPNASKSGRWQFSLRRLFRLTTYVALLCVAVIYLHSRSSVLPFINVAVFAAMYFVVTSTIRHEGAWRWFGLGFLLVWVSSVVLLPVIVGSFFRLTSPGVLQSSDFLNGLINFCFLASFPLAFLGGLLARYFYSTRAEEK